MWDILVLTAGSAIQKADFELYLKHLDLTKYAKEVTVIADKPDNVRIGSGGSTIQVIWNLYQLHGGNLLAKRILLVHSGGLSTRMPHISAKGKIFTLLPGNRTILELKLENYWQFSTIIHPGIVITASDVIEDVIKFREHPKDCDFLLFGHESSIETAKNHGVYVLDNRGNLKTVLQKPDEKLLKAHFEKLPQKFITDSFYWISWDVALKLKDLALRSMNFELCCYGDFLFSLGSKPNEDYMFEGDQPQRTLRRIIADTFKDSIAKVALMGADTFFHFGTATEFLNHIAKDSSFHRKFLTPNISTKAVNSTIKNLKLAPGARVFIENCELGEVEISGDCILSGISTNQKLTLDNTLMFTMDLINDKFVTFAFDIKENLKAVQQQMRWFGKDIGQTKPDMWSESFFPCVENREESLRGTLALMNQPGKTLQRIGIRFPLSISSAVALKDTQATIQRNELINKTNQYNK